MVALMRVVNVFAVELEEGPGRDGFWFRGAALGEALGAARIGAGLYEARADVPIWPYHYHYPDEEWLYVLDGAPVLRDAGGRRVLAAADVVCFAPGHRGAHTLEGPGRFIIFSGERSSGPFVSVYPDSDKVSIAPGIEQLNALRLPRGGSVDYWHGEGSGSVPSPAVAREPENAPGPVIVATNALDLAADGGRRWASIGDMAGARRLDAAVLELDPGADCGPYRYEFGRELWLMLTAGAATVQSADGERALSPGDLACFPDGPESGRRVVNRSATTARMLLLSTTGLPAAECHPKTGDWILRVAPGANEIHLRRC